MRIRATAEFAGFLTAFTLQVLVILLIGRYLPDPPANTIIASIEPWLTWGLGALALIYVLVRRYVRALLLLGLMTFFLYTYHAGLAEYRVVNQEVAEPQNAIKLLSFNILSSNTGSGADIADMLIASDADVVFVMEARPLRKHLDRLDEAFPYRLGCGLEVDENVCDLTVLSRLPLTKAQMRDLSPASQYPSRLATAEVEVDGKKITFVAAHLTKPFYGLSQYWEFRSLANRINEIDGSVILAGDFNAPTWAKDFRDLLVRADLKIAPNDPGTWPVAAGDLGIPIDHVLVSSDVSWFSLAALEDAMGSNHRGLEAEIAF